MERSADSVVITAYADKSLTFIMKTPPRRCSSRRPKIDKGSPRPHTDKVGRISRAQAEEIAKMKGDLRLPISKLRSKTIVGVHAAWH